jgi:hypothetical protein
LSHEIPPWSSARLSNYGSLSRQIAPRSEKAFGARRREPMRKLPAYEIAQTPKREAEIRVRWAKVTM